VAPSLAQRALAAAGVSVPEQGALPAPVRPTAPTDSDLPRPAGTRVRASATVGPAIRGSVILGIDPGTRIVGWGAIELTPRGPRMLAAGVIRAGSGDLPKRLGLIRRELDRVIELHRPIVVAVEEAFAHKNMQSALRIGEARGVVLSCASAVGVAVHQYPPAAAKKALVGNGAAHKSQVAAMVARRLELAEAPKPLDASDALALALTHVLRNMPRQRLSEERERRLTS
jgi:crossover junction endodeoxyribonuclease RuvC